MPDTRVTHNDPAELLEALDVRGRATGVPMRRSDVHDQGLWHRAFHCWVVRWRASGLEIVLQRRAFTKDTFPEYWDASAAGHWRFGESAEEAARELEEELGIQAPFDMLRYVGRERSQRQHANGLIDREYHEVYVLEWPAALSSYRPDPREVSGVAAVSARELIALASGARDVIWATEGVDVQTDGSTRAARPKLGRALLVPYSAARLRRLVRNSGGLRRVIGG